MRAGMSVRGLCAVLAASGLGLSLHAEDETWTSYFSGTPPTTGHQTIQAGHTVVINDAEMEASKDINSLRVPAGAVIKFNTTSAPPFPIEPSNGSSGGTAGTIEKISPSDWTMNKHAKRFTGDYIIRYGTVKLASAAEVFGPTASANSSHLYIEKGTSLIVQQAASTLLGTVRLHLAGTLEFLSGGSSFANPVFRFLTLEDDAEIIIPNGVTAYTDAYNEEQPSFIDLNGHDLSITGTGKLTLKNGSIKGAGNLTIGEGTEAQRHTLYLENYSIEGSSTDVLTMESYTALSAASALDIPKTVAIGDDSVTLGGTGWVKFSGGLSGSNADILTFCTNAVAAGHAEFPGRTIATGYEPPEGNYPSVDSGAIWVGHCATGGLSVASGSVVSNKLIVGGIDDGKKYGIGNGCVLQTGGEISFLGTKVASEIRYSSAVGWSAHGYYEHRGGTARAVGHFLLGYAAAGIIAQYDGTFEQVPHPLTPASTPWFQATLASSSETASDIPAVVYLKAGTMKLGVVQLNAGKRAKSVITLDGQTAYLETPERIYTTLRTSESDCGTTWINLNGGVLATPYVTHLRDGDASLYINFNGGTIKALPRTDESRLPNVFGSAANFQQATTRVTIGPNGAAIDTNGREMSVDYPMDAPTGKVVSAVPFEAETGWTVSPYVEIVDPEGAGEGATAFADFDAATGTLTGIHVTSGGSGYTAATARLIVSKTCVREIACTLADADASGSFTKKGSGNLDFNVANAYGGDTVVEGGSLTLRVVGALPVGSTVVLRGGTIETAAGVDFPSSIRLEMADLDPAEQYVLCSRYRGASVPAIANIPDGWKVVLREGKLILRANRGFILIFE